VRDVFCHNYVFVLTLIPSWQKVASDLFELNGQMYLLVIDYFSRYIEIAKLFNTSSQSVINHLKSIFARHGIPECFMSDGGPQYVSFVFKQFAQSYGFQHIVSSPRYAQSNVSFSLNERKIGNLGFNCFGAIGNKVCNFLPMRSSAGLYSLARGVAR
jgi:hypothetical protein